jgi:hypothetical protein
MTRGGGMSVKDVLDRFADWRESSNPQVRSATIAAREATVRRALRIKKAEPLVYRGLTLRCVGSARWRYEHPGEQA